MHGYDVVHRAVDVTRSGMTPISFKPPPLCQDYQDLRGQKSSFEFDTRSIYADKDTGSTVAIFFSVA